MKATVNWMKNGAFAGTCKNHTILMDVPDDDKAATKGMSPMDMLLVGAGGCTSYDVVQVLLEAGEDILDCQTQLEANTRDEHPQTFEHLHIHYVLTGKNLNKEKVEEAIHQSHTIYSAAPFTLAQTAKLSYDYKIVEA